MTSPVMITDPNAITTEWLSHVLQHNGINGGVTGFTMKSIGTGQVGENVRFRLEGNNVPESIVGKFSSPDPVSKKSAIQLGTYLREVFFYSEIQKTVDIATPTVLFADVDQETHDFVIMMEDLSPGIQGDQIAGCSVDEAAIAMEELAKLQGPRWGDVKLLNYPLLQSITQDDAQIQAFYRSFENSFLERFGDQLTEDYRALVPKVGDLLGRYNDKYTGNPPGLIHDDYRVDNMLFGGPRPLTIVDWQSLGLGCPVKDASYFLGTCLDTPLRQKEERHLLRHYLDVLKSYGVNLSEDSCFALYRNYAPAGFVTSVFGSQLFEQTERSIAMFMVMNARSAQMCLDLETEF